MIIEAPIPEPAPIEAERLAPVEEQPVDIHKPKPFHNLREFASEIVVIVTGILIALSLEQAIETWHWHHQVEAAEQALGNELSEAVAQARERELTSACVDRRLDDVAQIADVATSSGNLPPVGDLGMPPGRSWSIGTWQSTISGQTAEHMATLRRNGFSVTYGMVDMLSTTNAHEREVWQRIYSIVGPGRHIEPAELAALRQAITDARTDNQIMGLISVRVQQLTESFDVELNRPFIATLVQPRASYAVCQPIGAVPRHYGAAPIRNAIERARASPIGVGFAGKPVAGNH